MHKYQLIIGIVSILIGTLIIAFRTAAAKFFIAMSKIRAIKAKDYEPVTNNGKLGMTLISTYFIIMGLFILFYLKI